MGQAKQRGTREERIAQAQERDKTREHAKPKATKKTKSVMPAMLAAALAHAMVGTNLIYRKD